MKRIWLVSVLSMKDTLRAMVWIPLALSIIAAVGFLWAFSYGLNQKVSLDEVVSGYFVFLSGGLYLSGLVFGATSIALERRAGVMFTLPISRTEIVVGKLLGTQIVVACGLVVGYFIGLSLAVHYNLTGFANSRLALATALTMSFTYLCVSIPLGFWMSGAPALMTAWLIVNMPTLLRDLVDQRIATQGVSRLIEVLLSVVPGQINMAPLNRPGAFYNMFVDRGAYADLGRAAFLAFIFFMLLTAMAQKKELSTKFSNE